LRGLMVSSGLLPLLGVSPSLGRWFRPEEDSPGVAGGANPVILSHETWQEHFNSDPSIVGRSIQLDQAPYVVVGVMPPGFQFPIGPDPVDAWITVAVDAVSSDGKSMLAQRGVHYLEAIARLKPGVTGAQAEAQMRTIVDGLNRQYADDGIRGLMVSSDLSPI